MRKWFVAVSDFPFQQVKKNIYKYLKIHGLEKEIGEVVVKTDLVKKIEIFGRNDNSIPRNLRNSKNITWETLDGGLYQKTTVAEVNKHQGYIFIEINPEIHVLMKVVKTLVSIQVGIRGFLGPNLNNPNLPPSHLSAKEMHFLVDEPNILITKVNHLLHTETHEKYPLDEYNQTTVKQDIVAPTQPEKEGTVAVKQAKTLDIDFGIGDQVEVANFGRGIVHVIDHENEIIKVMIDFFGRETLIDATVENVKIVK